MDWGRKWVVDFYAGKTRRFSFDCLDNSGAINVKIGILSLMENHFLRCWEFCLILGWCNLIVFIAKNVFKKNGALIRSINFILRLCFISINLPYDLE